MLYRLRHRIYDLLRASKRALLPGVIGLMAVYFGLYAAFGPKGLDVLAEREHELALAKAELEILTEEHTALERRVRLLDGQAIDRDLLEEEARRVLNRAHPDEVIVLLPPPVLVSSEPLPQSPSDPSSKQPAAQ